MEPLGLDLTKDELATLAALPANSKRQTAARVAGACARRWSEEYGPPGDDETALVLPDQPSPYTQLGTAMHSWAYSYARHCKDSSQETDLAFGAELATRYAKDVPDGMGGDFFELIDNLMQSEPRVPPNAHVELSLLLTTKGIAATPKVLIAAEADEDPKFGHPIFSGTMDRAWYEHDQDVLVIRDWKSDHQIPPLGELQRHFQPLSYAALAALDFARAKGRFPSRVTASLYYVRMCATRDVSKSIDELAVWWHGDFLPRLRKIAELAKAEKFPASPCPGFEGCQGCPVLMACPVKEFVLKSAVGEIVKSPQKAGLAYLYAKTFVTRLQTALKEKANAEGPIDLGNGRVLGFTNGTSSVYTDIPAIVRLITAQGLSINDVLAEMSLSKTAVKKLLTKMEKTDRNLVLQQIDEQYSDIVAKSRFGATEVKKELVKENGE